MWQRQAALADEAGRLAKATHDAQRLIDEEQARAAAIRLAAWQTRVKVESAQVADEGAGRRALERTEADTAVRIAGLANAKERERQRALQSKDRKRRRRLVHLGLELGEELHENEKDKHVARSEFESPLSKPLSKIVTHRT